MRTKKAVKTASIKMWRAAAERFSRTVKTLAIDMASITREGIARKVPEDVRRRWRERNIGRPDYSERPPEPAAEIAGKSVARLISLADGEYEAEGFATGFIIAPGILMTNHHVFEAPDQAAGTGAQFLYEYGADNRLRRGVVFRLQPERFFIADETLDFALVAVDESSESGQSLSEFAPIPWHTDYSPVRKDDAVSIIQHPEGGHKRYAHKDNLVVDILDEGFVHYTTDTMPGSSGSPAFAKAWRLCALHHCGVPEMKGDDIITKTGTVWQDWMSDDEINWIANEGILLDKIFARVNLLSEQAPEALREYYQRLRNVSESVSPEMREGREADPSPQKPDHKVDTYRAPAASGLGAAPVTINIAVTNSHYASINISTQLNGVEAVGRVPGAPERAVRALERRIRFDTNYQNRRGYERDFLKVRIEMPEVAANRRSEMYSERGRLVVLPYHHFSLAMNQRRRMAMWTAANIDYNQRVRDDRDRDTFGDDYWTEDPRIPSELQLKDADFYAPATKVDRGHLVRRQDNAWGKTASEIEYGNSDTFHWTNCTPQHERFNRGMSGGQWGAFEDHLVKQIAGFDKQISILSGPVLADNDPGKDYGEGYVQYPLRFWKIIAGVEDGELQAFAFIFDQSKVIRRFGLERFDPGRFVQTQVTLDYVQEESGVRFPQNLLDADVLTGTFSGRFSEVTPTTIRRRSGGRRALPRFDEIL